MPNDETQTAPAAETAGAITAEQEQVLAKAGITLPGATAPRAIERIRGAFANKSWHIDVPEWDNLRIYFTPLTTADVQTIEANASSVTDPHERNLLLLIHKARGEDGRPLFGTGDIQVLKNEARFDVVSRVTKFMYLCGSLTPAEAKDELGNGSSSATTSPSPSGSA